MLQEWYFLFHTSSLGPYSMVQIVLPPTPFMDVVLYMIFRVYSDNVYNFYIKIKNI